MPGDAEATAELAQTIESLAPDQVETELSSIMQYGGRNLLAQTVGVSDIDASRGVLRAVEGAIDKVSSPTSRAQLGGKATEAVVSALRDNDFETNIFDAVTGLAASTDPFIATIKDPRDKAFKLMYLSEEMARRIQDHEDFDKAVSLAFLANNYVSRAKESADEIEDPAERSSMLARLGETSADNLGQAWDMIGGPSLGDGFGNREHRRVSRALQQFPSYLYREAVRSAEDIAKPEDRADKRAAIAISMARSISKMGAPESGVTAHMTTTTKNEIDEIVEQYETDKKLAKLPLAQKSYKLVHLGAKLAQVIDMDHAPSADLAHPIRQNLISATVNVFGAARGYAQAIPQPRIGRGSRRQDYPANLSFSASVAASRFVGNEFEQAKELYEIGFDIGVVADTFKGRHSHEASEVIDAIGEQARKLEDTREGFELFSLAHRLETGRLPENHTSHILGVNARRALRHLSESPSKGVAVIAPEEIDRDFVEFIVKLTASDTHTSWVQDLRNMNWLIQDPELKEAISERIGLLEAKDEEARRPKTETARIAEQIVSRR